MTEATIPERFFRDKDIRILHVNGNTTYIKRTYTEQGILYECAHRETVTTLDNINAVYEWIEEVKR